MEHLGTYTELDGRFVMARFSKRTDHSSRLLSSARLPRNEGLLAKMTMRDSWEMRRAPANWCEFASKSFALRFGVLESYSIFLCLLVKLFGETWMNPKVLPKTDSEIGV